MPTGPSCMRGSREGLGVADGKFLLLSVVRVRGGEGVVRSGIDQQQHKGYRGCMERHARCLMLAQEVLEVLRQLRFRESDEFLQSAVLVMSWTG